MSAKAIVYSAPLPLLESGFLENSIRREFISGLATIIDVVQGSCMDASVSLL